VATRRHSSTDPQGDATPRDLPNRRRARILDTVNRTGQARVGELATALRVSTETIRRDIRTLAAAGAVTCVHGGALAVTHPSLSHPHPVAHSDHPYGSPALPERRGGSAGLPQGATPSHVIATAALP